MAAIREIKEETMTKQDLILDTLTELKNQQSEMVKMTYDNKINLVSVNEHLKTINGRLGKAELNIEKLDGEVYNNKLSITKQLTIWGSTGGLGGIIGYILGQFFK